MALEEEEGGVTFSLDVGGDGEAALRNTIMNKLSDFMGSYTDDVLAEYVVVLVSHGKQRAQAVKDLEAFLGDQSESFVTWLWEHLAANMHLYTSASNDLLTKPDLVDMEPIGEGQNEEVVKSSEVTTQWKDKSHDTLPTRGGGRLISLKSNTTRQDVGSATLRATQVDLSGSVRSLNESTRRGAKRQRSPDLGLHSERAVSDKQKAPRVRATMRLLQSAVREAVAPTSGHSKRSLREAAAPVREARAPMREVRAPVRVSTAPTDSHSRQSESALKRLQSVVSADFESSEVASLQQPLKDARRPNSVRQGKKAMPAIMMAMKAAAAAAEDVTKVRGRLGGNIWDRLGKKGADLEDSDDEEDVKYGEENKAAVDDRLEDRYTSYYEEEYDHKKPRLESEDMLSEGSIEDGAVLSGSVFDEYTGQSMSSRNVYPVRGDKYHEDEWNGEDFVNDDKVEDGEDIRSERRRRRKEESVTVEYRLARNTDGVKESHKPKGSSTSSGLSNSSQKIVNISVNVNTWKPEAYDKVKDTGGSEQPALLPNQEPSQEQLNKGFSSNMISAPPGADVQEDGVGDLHTATASKPVRELQPEANDHSAKPPVATKEAPKAMPSAIIPAGVKPVRKVDDAESRTVFVTNIHFAASKESVMAHFASCGDIGRIVMLTDGATGQPKGSAYIEFKAKEASDRALALNDSSFYSRPLKVVRKDAAIQAIPLLHPALIHRRTLPLTLRLPAIGARLYRGAPYLVQQPRRFPAMPRPYGNFPSLQWKRDGPAAGNTNRPPGFNMPVRPIRSNSYVRASGPQPLKAGEELTAGPAQGGEETRAEGGAREQGDVQMEQE